MEWTKRLATEIAAARARGEHDDGRRCYRYWLAALEKLVAEKNLIAKEELSTRKHEWDVAARSPPHGRPITLPGRPRWSGAEFSEVFLPGLPVIRVPALRDASRVSVGDVGVNHCQARASLAT